MVAKISNHKVQVKSNIINHKTLLKDFINQLVVWLLIYKRLLFRVTSLVTSRIIENPITTQRHHLLRFSYQIQGCMKKMLTMKEKIFLKNINNEIKMIEAKVYQEARKNFLLNNILLNFDFA